MIYNLSTVSANEALSVCSHTPSRSPIISQMRRFTCCELAGQSFQQFLPVWHLASSVEQPT